LTLNQFICIEVVFCAVQYTLVGLKTEMKHHTVLWRQKVNS